MSWQIGDVTLESRFFLGSAGYPSPEVLRQSILASGAQVVTLGLRRQLGIDGNARSDNGFVDVVRSTGVHLLPNTSGCRSAREAGGSRQFHRGAAAGQRQWRRQPVVFLGWVVGEPD